MAPVTVEEYSRQFYAKALRGGFGGTPEESARAGSASLYALLKKLLDAGEREDCAVPLRVLRDELMEAHRAAASAAARKAPVEALFALYDGVVRLATDEAQGPPGPAKDLALVVLEEVRARFYKLVVGETWEPYPELKKLALLRLWGFRNAEKLEKAAAGDPEGNGAVLGLPPDHQVAGKKKGWLGKMTGGGADAEPKGYQSWQTTFKSMQRASGQKLMVLLEELLVEFCGDVSDSTEAAAADELGEAVPIAGGPPQPLARKVTEGPPVGESAGTLQGDALIDLLTLEDPAPAPSPAPTPDLFAAQAPPPPAPAAAPDLFAAQASPASSTFASPPPPPAAPSSNPFAEDMFFQAAPPPEPAAGAQAEVQNSFFADLNPGFKQ